MLSSHHTYLDAYRFFTLFLFALIAILHAVGHAYSLYYLVWWYDIPMHLLGGFAVALLAAYVFYLRPRKLFSFEDVGKILPAIFLAVLTIGILWEIFEWGIDRFIAGRPFDIVDTSADLMNDLLGGWAGVQLFLKFQKGVAAEAVEAKILL